MPETMTSILVPVIVISLIVIIAGVAAEGRLVHFLIRLISVEKPEAPAPGVWDELPRAERDWEIVERVDTLELKQVMRKPVS